MKSLTIFAALVLTAALFVGYYEKLEDASPEKVYFIKQQPTLKIRFVNIFANEADDKKLSELTPEERQQVIEYCRYRLGIHAEPNNPQALEQCKQR